MMSFSPNTPEWMAPLLAAGLALTTTGCDWDKYDPRLAEDAGAPATGDNCGRIDVLSDDFEDGEGEPQWDGYSSGGDATESGGQLQLTSGAASTHYGSFISERYYDFREGSVAVEVTSLPDLATPARLELHVRRSDHQALVTRVSGNVLSFHKSVNGGAEIGSIAFDAGEHRWWRIRQADDSVFWETSANGSAWSVQAEEQLDGLFDLDYVQVRLVLYSAGADPATTASFDNVTTTGPGDGSWCPASVLRDDFSDDELADQWLHRHGSGGISAVRLNGQLTISPVAELDEDSYYSYIPSRLYDLTDSAVSLEVIELPKPPATTFLRVSQGTDSIEMSLSEGMLTCSYGLEEGGTTVVEEPFVPAAHRWWRIRLAGNAIHWEASRDGVSWSDVGLTSPNPIEDLTAADLRFGITIGLENPGPGHARFDNFNVTPQP
ncbi:MAG: hypothetical protein JRI68_11210 [Deltaproteobacteria bacterium]|nr:hypothetical protein [Deltaproteobacteria bacterium]